MSEVGEAIRQHHQELLAQLIEHVRALLDRPSESDPMALVRFLQEELLPHAQGEEQHLYPAVEPLIKAHGQATATMSVDHEFLEGLIRQIAEVATSQPLTEQGDWAPLQRLALQLEAVLRLHLEKEERVYLPLFEGHLSEQEQRRVLEGMHEAYAPSGADAEKVVDVRPLAPRDRHPLIFQTFDALRPGESFVLVNDHDPRPLYYQFAFEREGQFTWTYLEQGPEVWRVRIGRVSDGS